MEKIRREKTMVSLAGDLAIDLGLQGNRTFESVTGEFTEIHLPLFEEELSIY